MYKNALITAGVEDAGKFKLLHNLKFLETAGFTGLTLKAYGVKHTQTKQFLSKESKKRVGQ